MKKLLFLSLLFAGNILSAQQNLFEKIKIELKNQYPEINVENKIIIINTWSVNDAKSREVNAEINKSVNTFEFAKLKGGSKGVIAVVVNTDNDHNMEEITLKKDKIVKPFALTLDNSLLVTVSNIVYDSQGKEIYKDLQPAQLFSSIQNLITR